MGLIFDPLVVVLLCAFAPLRETVPPRYEPSWGCFQVEITRYQGEPEWVFLDDHGRPRLVVRNEGGVPVADSIKP